jgi:two-component system response regulator AtoC
MTQASRNALVAVSLGSALEAFSSALRALENVSIVPADGVAAALRALDAHAAEGLVIDCDAFGDTTYDLLATARERWPGLPMLVLSAEPTRERELAVVAAGGLDLVERSSAADLALAYQKLRATQRIAASLPPPQQARQLLLGKSAAMQRVARAIAQVAPTRAAVLIRGESGTGKELVARALHEGGASPRSPFIKIDCTSLPEALLESELFGHEKGAFTGAVSRKLGRVELAHGGTLFLDEVGELTLPIQAKLLRVLQDREFERLGGTRTIGVDVRVLAATHRDLESMVERGQFRQDLFYRLNVVPIWLPPLRARRDDVPELAEYFCREAAQRNGRSGCRLEVSAVALLAAQRWPGNVRQLHNFVERLVVLSESDSIDAVAVRVELDRPVQFTTDSRSAAVHAAMGAAPEIAATVPERGGGSLAPGAAGGALASAASAAAGASSAGSVEGRVDAASSAEGPLGSPSSVASEADAHLSQVVRDAERAALLRAIERSGGNRSDAARVLGVSRSTFYAKLKEYGLT